MAQKSRAEYFRTRREEFKTFTVLLRRKKALAFEKFLKNKGITKVDWLNAKIDEEMEKE